MEIKEIPSETEKETEGQKEIEKGNQKDHVGSSTQRKDVDMVRIAFMNMTDLIHQWIKIDASFVEEEDTRHRTAHSQRNQGNSQHQEVEKEEPKTVHEEEMVQERLQAQEQRGWKCHLCQVQVQVTVMKEQQEEQKMKGQQPVNPIQNVT